MGLHIKNIWFLVKKKKKRYLRKEKTWCDCVPFLKAEFEVQKRNRSGEINIFNELDSEGNSLENVVSLGFPLLITYCFRTKCMPEV